MAKVTIRGKEFPLCLTVAALDEINEKCGGLSGVVDFLNGSGELSKAFRNTAWMLTLLMAEGEKNNIVCAGFDGNTAERKELPSYEQLCTMVTIHTMMGYRADICNAIHESMKQDIEASYSKNAENAELE